jgi:excisionase family DNA binding protein/PAS domain S-box-containing protein
MEILERAGHQMRLLTATEAAELLQVKGDTLYSLIDREELPAAKVGGQWRFLEEDLITWFKSKYSVKSQNSSGGEKDDSGLEIMRPGIYRSLVSATFDANLISCENIIIDCNNIALELYDYAREDLIGKSLKTLLVPEFHEAVDETLALRLSGVIQRVHRRRDGTVLPVEISMRSFRDGKRNLRLGAIRNISHLPMNQFPEDVQQALKSYPLAATIPVAIRSCA